MILKIKEIMCLGKFITNNGGYNWIFDGIESIQYIYIKVEEDKIDPSSYKLRVLYTDKDKKKFYMALRIIFKYSDPDKESSFILLQNCNCYLCNAEGKTIDKLVC